MADKLSGAVMIKQFKKQLAVGNEKNQDSVDENSGAEGETVSFKVTKEDCKAQDYFPVVARRSKMVYKLKAAAPFNMFYTTVTSAPQTHRHPLSITFQELLDPSLGALECSLQITCYLETGWLLAHYKRAGYSDKPLTVLYRELTADEFEDGDQKDKAEKAHEKANVEDKKQNKVKNAKNDQKRYREVDKKENAKNTKQNGVKTAVPENVEVQKIELPFASGWAHSKIMMLCYEDGSLRIVIGTANLKANDWDIMTQGVWISRKCPRLPSGASSVDGESRTGFKKDLLEFLNAYESPCIAQYYERLQHADLSHINVFLVASVPGYHNGSLWGMRRIEYLLSKHCIVPTQAANRWEVYVQSIGMANYGKKPQYWLLGPFLQSFSRALYDGYRQPLPPISIIYPSRENALAGRECPMCPYRDEIHKKQKWLEDYLYQWKADSTARTGSVPFVNTYVRVSPHRSRAAFFLLTSANISKPAWGSSDGHDEPLHIKNYEAGVLFLPRFVVDADYFNLTEGARKSLLLPYDVPLTPYAGGMTPWRVNT